MVVRTILGTTLGLQSTALLGRAVRIVPKHTWSPKAKPLGSKKLVKGFVDISVGTALLRPTSRIVNTF